MAEGYGDEGGHWRWVMLAVNATASGRDDIARRTSIAFLPNHRPAVMSERSR